MKTKILAPLFAVAFAAGIGFPVAAVDDVSGVKNIQPFFTMSAVQPTLKDFEAVAAAPIVLSGVTEWDLTPQDFVDATR